MRALATILIFLTLLQAPMAGAQSASPIGGGAVPTKRAQSARDATGLGLPTLGVRNDADANLTTGDLQYSPFSVTASGRVKVDATLVEAATAADGAAAPALGKMAAGLDGGGNLQYLSVDTNGELQVDALSLPGGLRGYAEDVPHVSGDFGLQTLAVRNDAGTVLAADGDYHPLTVDSTGRLRVDASTTEVATVADGGALPALTKVVSGYDGANVQAIHTDVAGDLQVDVLSSALPTGAATSANQTTANTSLASIDSKLGTLGQQTMAGSAAVVIASDQSAIPASQSGTWNINNISGTVSLPTGAATATNQTTANTSLASIDGKFGSLGQKNMAGSAPVVIASDQSAIPASQSGTWNVTNISGTISLPTGAATLAEQQTQTTALQLIDDGVATTGAAITTKGMAAVGTDGTDARILKTDITGELQVDVVSAKAPVNSNGSQTTTTVGTTAATLTAPANAVGFILQSADTNTANMRWRVGAAATTTVGQQLQPGRDTGYVPMAANISIISESGTQEYQVQWVLSQ